MTCSRIMVVRCFVRVRVIRHQAEGIQVGCDSFQHADHPRPVESNKLRLDIFIGPKITTTFSPRSSRCSQSGVPIADGPLWEAFHNDAHSIRTKTNAKPGRIGLPQRDLSCVICMRSSFCGAGHLPCPRVGKECLSQSSKRVGPRRGSSPGTRLRSFTSMP